MLRMYKNVMLGEANATTSSFKDLDTAEFIGFGIYCID